MSGRLARRGTFGRLDGRSCALQGQQLCPGLLSRYAGRLFGGRHLQAAQLLLARRERLRILLN